jgi:phosphoglycolate phosphatase-like HAD superfamily hydrolase
MNTFICFDLDGTLLDVKKRYYRLYKEALERCGRRPLSQGVYSRCVRSGMKHYQIFDKWHDHETYGFYIQYRNERIEDEEYLRLDRPVQGIRRVLQSLSVRFHLVVISNRDDYQGVVGQLERHRFSRAIDACSCAGFDAGSGGKSALLRRYSCDYIVGDTEVDIEAGRNASVKPIAVSWGLRHKDILKQFHTESVLEKPFELSHFFDRRG